MFAGIGLVMLLWRPRLMEHMLPTRFWLDSNHFLFAVGGAIVGLAVLLRELKGRMQGNGSNRSWLGLLTAAEMLISLVLACVAGVLIFLKIPVLEPLACYAYTIFDLAIALVVLGSLVSVWRHVCRMTLH